MKKTIGLVLISLFLGGATAIAAERGTPEYEKLKEYKKAQREKKASGVSEKTGPTFWDREAERSGLNRVNPNFSGFIKALNPIPFLKEQDKKFEERKATGTTK